MSVPSVVNEPPQSTDEGEVANTDQVLVAMVYFQNVLLAPPLNAYTAPFVYINAAPEDTAAGVFANTDQVFNAGSYFQKSVVPPRNA